MPENTIPVYKEDFKIASERGETETWRKSARLDIACIKEIDKVAADHFRDNHLDTDLVIKTVAEKYGMERVSHVLALQVVSHEWDGRYHNDVKDWAKDNTTQLSPQYIEEITNMMNFVTHPIVIDGLSSKVMELEKNISISTPNKETEKTEPKKEFVSQKDRVRDITDKLENGIKELFSSDKFKNYLNTMSKFHNYSFNNTMLIAMQKPEATMVAGFNSWKNNFERNVNKGEKGIQIVVPAPYKVKEELERIDPITQQPVLDKDGKPVVEEVEITKMSFKVASVFDVSQTSGKELPTLGADELKGEVKDFEAFFDTLREISPVPIKIEPVENGAKGFFHQENKEITVNEGMSDVQTVKTAIHEIAHAKLHDKDIKAENAAKDRKTEEVEAESIAYTVCQHFGIDTSDYSFAYVATWGSGKEVPELKSSLETIRSTSSEIINAIEEKYRGLEKEQQQEKVEEKSSKSNIIGNTDYKSIADKQYVKVDNAISEKLSATLNEKGVQFSGRVGDEKTTFTFSKADSEKFKEARKEAVAPEKSKPKHEHKWETYIIADLKTWSDNGRNEPLSKLETFDSFKDAKARFDELRGQAYNSEKSITNGIPTARLTLGIQSANEAYDLIQVRDNKNVLVDDFTRSDTLKTDKEAMWLINQVEKQIGIDSVMVFKEQENGKLADIPDMIPFAEWDKKPLEYVPFKEALDIIGNTDYKDIEVKAYVKLPTEKAKAIAEKLDEKGVSFSGRINGDETTLTVSRKDMPKYRAALAELDKPIEEKSINPKVYVEPDGRSDNLFVLKEIETGLTVKNGTKEEIIDFCKEKLAANLDIARMEKMVDLAEEKRPRFKEHAAVMDKLASEEPQKEEFLINGTECTAGIYQLIDIPENHNKLFASSERLETIGITPNRDDYRLIASFEVFPEDMKNINDFLENVYEKYNLDKPADFLGHSLSVSDVVVIKNGNDLSAHYVDTAGFKQLDSFGLVKENPLKAVEDIVEQNDNNFDGIINNTPSMAELEERAKRGEAVSLMDVMEAEKREREKPEPKTEKKSIRGYLKNAQSKPKNEQENTVKNKTKGVEI